MWFDPRAALAEIEAAPPANPANSANPTPDAAGQFAGFAGFAAPGAPKAATGPGPALAGFAEFAGFATPPGADAEIPLDPEGLPVSACPACGGGAWWKPASQPFTGKGWHGQRLGLHDLHPAPPRDVAPRLRGAARGRAMTPRLLVTVRPGPVLHLWQDGREVARLPLEAHAALTLAADLLRAVREALAEGGDAPQTA